VACCCCPACSDSSLFLRKLFADSAYGGPIFRDGIAKALPDLAIDIVRRGDNAQGFVVEPKRWIVERTIDWLNQCRRLAKGLGKTQSYRTGLL
jgi:transposase